jgi:transposase
VPLPREVRGLQAFVRRLDALEGMRTQERNPLAAAPADTVIRASIQHVIDLLEDEMVTLRTRIHDHFDQHPGLRAQRELLTSIPGIGEATAAVLLAEFGPFTRFRQAAPARPLPASARGTATRAAPCTANRCSPSSARPGCAKALFYPAMVALRYNPIIAAFGKRLRARGKHKMVVIGAAMRKLVHLAYGVIKTGNPSTQNLCCSVDFKHGLSAVNVLDNESRRAVGLEARLLTWRLPGSRARAPATRATARLQKAVVRATRSARENPGEMFVLLSALM